MVFYLHFSDISTICHWNNFAILNHCLWASPELCKRDHFAVYCFQKLQLVQFFSSICNVQFKYMLYLVNCQQYHIL